MKYTSQNKTTIVKQDVEYKWVILNYEAQDMKIIKDESKRKGKKSLDCKQYTDTHNTKVLTPS